MGNVGNASSTVERQNRSHLIEMHWSGRRESNPRMQLGKLPFYH